MAGTSDHDDRNHHQALEPLELAEAKSRQLAGLKQGKSSRSAHLSERDKGQRRDKVAAAVGLSHATLTKARAVVESAAQDPERYGALVTEMDRTGNVSSAYQSLQRLQRQHEAELAGRSRLPKQVVVRHCSMATLLTTLRDVDCILTDPLYDKGSIPVYEELAKLASVSLRPGGTLAVLCGQSYLPEILAGMSAHLPFRWMLAFLTPTKHCRIHHRKVYSRWKPVLVFEKPHSASSRRGWLPDVIESSDSGRVRHRFEQSEGGFMQLVEMLTEPGELVVDPFLGCGTTGAACVKTGRRFVGCDVDAAAVRLARARLGGPIGIR